MTNTIQSLSNGQGGQLNGVSYSNKSNPVNGLKSQNDTSPLSLHDEGVGSRNGFQETPDNWVPVRDKVLFKPHRRLKVISIGAGFSGMAQEYAPKNNNSLIR